MTEDTDLLADLGVLALGSRLRRLAERLQADAAAVLVRGGYPTQPAHFPLIAALDRAGPTSVGALASLLRLSQPGVTRGLSQLVGLGLVTLTPDPTDGRHRIAQLTPEGEALVLRMRRDLWPKVTIAAQALTQGADASLLEHLRRIELRLDEASLEARAHMMILEYDDALAGAFYDINAEWISAMYTLEDIDRAVLSDPRHYILDKGGVILFASTPELGVVGTCALMPKADGEVELTKMGVRASARGRKIGEPLLAAAIARAQTLPDMKTLFLLTNKKAEAAIYLYEKHGFQHDADIMARHGAAYERCNVAMRYVPPAR
jgi:DNA-binding MarR family transcriptional regulator/predicted GNAT family N-acyltransferase